MDALLQEVDGLNKHVILEDMMLTVQAHAARPLEGKNPIEPASLLLQPLGNIPLHTSQKYSVVMTQLKAGGISSNVIPELAHLTLDIRASTNDQIDELRQEIASLIEHVAEIRKTPIIWNSCGFAPAAKPNLHAIAILENAGCIENGEGVREKDEQQLLSVSLIIRETRALQGQLIQSMLAEIGIKVKNQLLEGGAYYDATQ
ncbi:peptidase dimerization domain-containing protein [Brevibacillus choshinensis]|uniref:peptidase dimerization domain-containing protein n=1 Tax=Brevibacillus choshinensis TaxID=54911 RepID=UPI002E1FF0DC|nr:peptidase dimerization domain-containing protein [Brevibacillus choshinensis]